MLIVLGLYSRIKTLFLRQSEPPARSILNLTNTEVAQLSNKDPLSVLRHPPRLWSNQNSAVALGSRNNMISIQPEECADEWRQNNADLKLLENCVMNGFIIFGIMFMTATGLENSPQSFGVYTVSQWPIYKNSIIPDWFEKWRDIKFWYMC